jgi:cytochrome c oxidase subunit 4
MNARPNSETPDRSAIASAFWRRNLIAWVAVLLLVMLTLWLAYLPLGRLNLPLALLIAVTKTAIVAVVFMRLGEATGLIRLAASIGFLWIAIMFGLTFADLVSRSN